MKTDRLVRKAGKTFTTWRPWLSIKPSANLAGLLALPCRIAEFSCVPPHNEEEKTVDPDELSTTNTKLLNNYFWQMVIYKKQYDIHVSENFRTCGLPTVMVIWMCVTVEISGHDDAQRHSWRLKSNVAFETNPSEQPSWSATITDTLTNSHQYKLVIKVYSWLLSFTHVHKMTYIPRYLAKTRRFSVYIYIYILFFPSAFCDCRRGSSKGMNSPTRNLSCVILAIMIDKMSIDIYIYWLVVSTPLKNMKVNGKETIPYMKWNIKAMFETTNQCRYIYIYILYIDIW